MRVGAGRRRRRPAEGLGSTAHPKPITFAGQSVLPHKQKRRVRGKLTRARPRKRCDLTRSLEQDTTRPSAQAFIPEYLELLDQRDEPGTGRGHLALFDENLIAALNVADGLVRSPFQLAWLLDGAGGIALRYAGRLAAVRARGG